MTIAMPVTAKSLVASLQATKHDPNAQAKIMELLLRTMTARQRHNLKQLVNEGPSFDESPELLDKNAELIAMGLAEPVVFRGNFGLIVANEMGWNVHLAITSQSKLN